MRAVLDTNVIIRHLAGDHASQSARATRLFETEHELVLSDVILAETIYVLESVYELGRPEIAFVSLGLLAFPSVEASDPVLLLRALELYVEARIDFADAYAAAQAEVTGVHRVVSFDRTLDRVRTIERIEP